MPKDKSAQCLKQSNEYNEYDYLGKKSTLTMKCFTITNMFYNKISC